MMTAPLTGLAIDVRAAGGEEPLPGELGGPRRRFALEAGRHPDSATARLEIPLVLLTDPLDLLRQWAPRRGGDHRHPVFAALAAADANLAALEIQVLHAQREGLGKPQARPI